MKIVRPSTVLAALREAMSPDAVAPLPHTPRTTWVLSLTALLIAVAGWLDLYQHYDVSAPGATVAAIARALPVLLCLYRPLAAWWLALAAAIATAAPTHPVSDSEPWPWAVTSVFCLVVVLTVIALRAPRRVLVTLWLILLAAGTALVVLRGPVRLGDLLPITILSALAPLTAEAIGSRGAAQRRLVVVEEISQAEHARRTLLEERTRIARELHDVVAHHMSVITVQADSAPYRIADLPPAAADEFGSIAAEARRSLTEMRRLLHVLRQDTDAGAEVSPQPGLAELPVLIETAHRAGLDAHLSVAETVPTPDRVPVGVQLSAYRLVQESLSNVVRHAPGTTVRVTVTGDASALRITVVNSAPEAPEAPGSPGAAGASGTPEAPGARGSAGAPNRPVETHDHTADSGPGGTGTGTGQGLIGMRERAAMLAGELHTEALPDGGFRVAAMLPLPPADATPATTTPGAA
ncbi:sensor histidine kinase [Embleya scabrispora]|uniref:sensor histidine kinase n=1 Tax=Embleya scabrispora TaxID=159449 RepID=UPI0003741F4F|nr:histidine kinase [Embleya scabrispora]MYS79088.1 sensor histidine kinase [Streptomyces sp. SID5474]